jgi:hypothetical protein
MKLNRMVSAGERSNLETGRVLLRNDDERGGDQKPRWHFRLVVLNFLSHSVLKKEPPNSELSSG